MTQLNQNVVGIDAAIFMHPLTWKASGHVDGFNDPMIDNKDSKKRYRADQLLEGKAEQYEKDGQPEKAKALLAEMGRLLSAEDLISSICCLFSPNSWYRAFMRPAHAMSRRLKNPRWYRPRARWNALAPRMIVLSTSKNAATRGPAAGPLSSSVGSATRSL